MSEILSLPLYDKIGGAVIATALYDHDLQDKVKGHTWVKTGNKIHARIEGKSVTLLKHLFGNWPQQIRRLDASKLDFRRENLRFPKALEELGKEGIYSVEEDDHTAALGLPGLEPGEVWKVLYDQKHYDLVRKYSWNLAHRVVSGRYYVYIVRTVRTDVKTVTINLARVILGLQDPETGEATNNDGLVASYKIPPTPEGKVIDLRSSNLIIATRSVVSHRRKTSRKKKNTKYLGVYKHGKRWRAEIHTEGKLTTIGVYDTDFEAAKARDQYVKLSKAELYYRLNFPEE